MHTHEEQVSKWAEIMAAVPDGGILPSPPDPRDYSVARVTSTTHTIPTSHSLPRSPLILNQGNTGYCAGASGAGIANSYYFYHDLLPQDGFSMTFLYWLAKEYDGIPHLDGTYIRTLLKVMKKYGVAPLALAPFSERRIYISPEALKAAEEYKVEAYARLTSLYDIKSALLKGLYVIMGTLVTRDNWNRPDGFLSYPSGPLYGGHATFNDGYNSLLKREHKGYLLGQNSWGDRWGDYGRFYLPYDFLDMTLPNGIPVFLEAWAVKFEEVKPDFNDPRKHINQNIRDRIENIKDRRNRR